MGGPLVARAAGKAIMKSPAGKKLKKIGIDAGKKLVARAEKTTRNYIQKSTSNSTVKDGLTQGMMRLNPTGQMAQGIKTGIRLGRAQAAEEGVKGAALGFGVGLASGMLGKKKKK